MSYKIEIVKADGYTRYWGGGTEYDNAHDADVMAEYLWAQRNESGLYERFSVVDSDGETYSDWEC